VALKSGVDRSGFDLSVKPGDDFFQHVNGTWIKRNPIPPEYSRWGSFPKLRDDNLIALREILDDLPKQKAALSDERRKLRDFYRTAMDEAEIQRLGASPLKPSLQRIGKIESQKELVTDIGRLRATGIDTLFNLSSSRTRSKVIDTPHGWIKAGWVCQTEIITSELRRIRAVCAICIANM